jgi:hypothetical protein
VEGLRTRFAGGKDLRGGLGRRQEEKDPSLTKRASAYANPFSIRGQYSSYGCHYFYNADPDHFSSRLFLMRTGFQWFGPSLSDTEFGWKDASGGLTIFGCQGFRCPS